MKNKDFNTKVLQALRIIIILLRRILMKISEAHPCDSEDLVDNADAKKYLQICDKSLQRRRDSGKIPFVKIGGKYYYPKSFFTHQFKK